MKIYYNQLQQSLEKELKNFYFIYGTPENLAIDAKESIESCALKKGFQIEKYFVDSHFEPNKLLDSMNNLELFQEKRFIELHILDQKPPKKAIDFIMEYLIKETDDIICLIKASFVKNSDLPNKLIKAMDLKGIIIPIYELKPWQIKQWLNYKIDKLSLKLSETAKSQLSKYIYDSSELGHQILERLKLNYGDTLINEAYIESSLDDTIQGNIFNLINFSMSGEVNKTLALLHKLQKENIETTILLWNLATEIHALAIAAKHIADGNPINEVVSDLNPFKKDNYVKVLQRLTYPQIIALALRLPHIDNLNKGLANGNPWLELEEILLILCGKQILPAFMKIKHNNK